MYTIFRTERTMHGIAAVRLLTMLGMSLAVAVSTMGRVHRLGFARVEIDVDGLDIVLAPMGYKVAKHGRVSSRKLAELYATTAR